MERRAPLRRPRINREEEELAAAAAAAASANADEAAKIKCVQVSLRDHDGDGFVTSVPVGTRYEDFCTKNCVTNKTRFVNGPYKGLNPRPEFRIVVDIDLVYDQRLYL